MMFLSILQSKSVESVPLCLSPPVPQWFRWWILLQVWLKKKKKEEEQELFQQEDGLRKKRDNIKKIEAEFDAFLYIMRYLLLTCISSAHSYRY